jgi:hypothetical protein
MEYQIVIKKELYKDRPIMRLYLPLGSIDKQAWDNMQNRSEIIRTMMLNTSRNLGERLFERMSWRIEDEET